MACLRYGEALLGSLLQQRLRDGSAVPRSVLSRGPRDGAEGAVGAGAWPHVAAARSWALLLTGGFPRCCLAAHFDYQYGYRKFEGSDGSRTQKYASNITYYFDNISSTELYSVDQELLKDYIKRQM